MKNGYFDHSKEYDCSLEQTVDFLYGMISKEREKRFLAMIESRLKEEENGLKSLEQIRDKADELKLTFQNDLDCMKKVFSNWEQTKVTLKFLIVVSEIPKLKKKLSNLEI